MRFTFNLNKKEFSMKKAKMLSLTASLVLAITFTLSCSDDDSGGGYISCSELHETIHICNDRYETEYEACKNNQDCKDGVEDKINNCMMDKTCGGNSLKECEAYYEDKCDEF
jgi:hypothetical protein